VNKFALLSVAVCSGLSMEDCRVYAALLGLSKCGSVVASIADIKKASGVHRFSVQRSLRSLADKRLIVAQKCGTKKPSYEISGAPKKTRQLSAVERTALSAVEPPVNDGTIDFCAYKERAHARKALGASPSKRPAADVAAVGSAQ